jgi:hypothetical protein
MGEALTRETYFQSLTATMDQAYKLDRDLLRLFESCSLSDEEMDEHVVRLVQEFLECGGSPNAYLMGSVHILKNAVQISCSPLVKLLLDKGADVNVANALYVFIKGDGHDMTILDTILRAGANLDGFEIHQDDMKHEKAILYGTVEECLESIESSERIFYEKYQLLATLQRVCARNANIRERIRLERSRRTQIQNLYQFLKVSKHRSKGIHAHVLQNDMVRTISELVVQRTHAEIPEGSSTHRDTD